MSESTVEISNGRTDLPACRRAIREAAREMGFKPQEVGDIVCAVFEACVNAVTYGRRDTAEPVTLHIHTHPDHFAAVVTDPGTGFHFDDEGAPQDSVRGRGIPLMKKFMDEVRFECGNGCKVTLIKYLNKD